MENDVTSSGVALVVEDAGGQCEFEFDLTPEFEARYQLTPSRNAPRNTKRKGDISEARVLCALLDLGYLVSVPFGENQRYDLLIDDGETISRVQVKTGRLRNGVILFSTVSTHAHRGRPAQPYHGQVEYVAVYCPDTEKVYIVPESHLTRSLGSLRITPTKNNVAKTVRWASAYELP